MNRVTIVKESDNTILQPIKNIEEGVVIEKARLLIKATLETADASALVDVSITRTLSADGQVEMDADNNKATLNFKISKALTSLLVAGTRYVYAMKVEDNGGLEIRTPEMKGTCLVEAAGITNIP
jgi:hypothetical protein